MGLISLRAGCDSLTRHHLAGRPVPGRLLYGRAGGFDSRCRHFRGCSDNGSTPVRQTGRRGSSPRSSTHGSEAEWLAPPLQGDDCGFNSHLIHHAGVAQCRGTAFKPRPVQVQVLSPVPSRRGGTADALVSDTSGREVVHVQLVSSAPCLLRRAQLTLVASACRVRLSEKAPCAGTPTAEGSGREPVQ